MCNCDCIWPLTHIQKWIPVFPFLCICLLHTHTYSDIHKEKDLEKEKMKTAPIWCIYHLSFSITVQNWAKCSLLYSFPSFSPYSLIHAGLETKWVCKKAVHYFPLWFLFSVAPWLLSAHRNHQEMLFCGYMGELWTLWKVSHRSEVESLSATAITAILSPGGQGKCVLSNSPEDYQGGKDC